MYNASTYTKKLFEWLAACFPKNNKKNLEQDFIRKI